MYRAIGVPGLVLLLGLVGCVTTQSQTRSPEEIERDKDLETIRLVADVTEVGNAGPLLVHGVGLVTDLEGTGGAPRGEWRTMLEKDLRLRKIENVSRLLDSPNNALVLVSAVIPPGCRKHEPLDLQIVLPPGSPVTSLRGGYLQPCILRNYETTKSLDPDSKKANQLFEGHKLAVGKGPLLVGFGNPDEPAELRKARVWEGGTSLIERPFYLVMKKDDRSAFVANRVAARINTKFPEDPQKQQFVQRHRQLFLLEDVTQQIDKTFDPNGFGRGDTAKAMNKDAVNLRVPYAYRYNPERYLRVARLIPLSDDAESQSKYRRRLEKMLYDPQDCIRAALRLEALGGESIPTLKKALTSDAPLVRFAAAEALVYLGSTAGVETLASLAVDQPNVRAYTLIALAGLNESVCRTKLQELLTHNDAELRAGAFHSLRLTVDEDHCPKEGRTERERDESVKRYEAAMRRILGGENLQAFWLHQVAPQSARAVNFALTKRAEIVLFGNDLRVVAPVRVRAGTDFIFTADAGDDRCFLSRINAQHGEQRVACSMRLDDVLRKLVDLGGTYPEAVDLLRKLDDQQGLNCPVAILTPPQATPLEALLAEGRSGPNAPGNANGE